MLEANTRIYVRDPEREDNLVPGVVQELLGQKIMVRFLQPVHFRAGAKTAVYFHNQSNCFTQAPCQVQRMFSAGQYPTGALMITGDEDLAETRKAFRVDVVDGVVGVTINGQYKGEVTNISCSGMGVAIDIEDFDIGSWVNATIHYDCEDHTGRMQVRSTFQDRSKRFRYGLMADPDDPNLVSQLSRITQELQNLKARRISRIGVNNKAKLSDSSEPAQADEEKAAEQAEQAESRDGKRQHRRNPWPGMAKVYVREEQNMRVLSVETGDLSRGGISFTCPKYIYEGSEVLFEKPVSGGFFRVMLEVRNVFVLGGNTHRIGAKFIGAPLKQGKMPKAFEGFCDAA